jgi:predicted NBD/HSP70 family sugar kinase
MTGTGRAGSVASGRSGRGAGPAAGPGGGRSGGQASAGDLLQLVRSGRATTRGALQQATGLSRATVGQRLDRLFRAGWLREGAGGPVDSPLGGRPSITLEFDTDHAVVLAADLDTRHARAAVLSLSGEILAEHGGTLVVEDGPEHVLGELGRWFAELLEKAGHAPQEVCGVGLAVPGPVDTGTGRVVQPPMMPGWDGYDIRGRLARAVGDHAGAPSVPVLVDNDANLMAYGEQRTGHPDCSAFVLVKVSTGIGAGVVVDGSVYRGVDGGAGDIGHIRVPEGADALCRCGAYGCLAAVASGGAVARRLAEAGVRAASGSDVRDLLAAGHPEAMGLAREAGRRVGDVLATAARQP